MHHDDPIWITCFAWVPIQPNSFSSLWNDKKIKHKLIQCKGSKSKILPHALLVHPSCSLYPVLLFYWFDLHKLLGLVCLLVEIPAVQLEANVIKDEQNGPSKVLFVFHPLSLKNITHTKCCEDYYLEKTNVDRVHSSQHFSGKFFISPPSRLILCSKSWKHQN